MEALLAFLNGQPSMGFMDAVRKPALASVEEYLALEQSSEVRHEYIGGVLHAMAGATVRHNKICVNLVVALGNHLRGGRCGLFVSDVKVRLQIAGDDIFYYPDVMVNCDSRDTNELFHRYPQVILEVLSEGTERIDRREKFLSYTQIESLAEYVLVAQDKLEVTLFRRANQWQPEVLRSRGDQLSLGSLGFEQPLESIYEGTGL
jgi:Uma2 family endonuclease